MKKKSELRLSVPAKLLFPFLVFFGLVPAAVVILARDGALSRLTPEEQMTAAAVGGAVLLAGALVGFFAYRLARQLRQLRTLAEAVGRGDFSRRARGHANDEFGDLAESFNRMTENLQNSRVKLEKVADTLDDTRAQLVQSEKLSAVGQFVAGVAHELNNPLTVVIGFSDHLVEGATDEKNRRHLEMVAKSARRCHKIVANLLGFARANPMERTSTQINTTLDQVIEFMAYDLRTSNIDVIKDYQAGLPAILADSHQLQQVFVNIIGNARQATEAFRRDGRIIVRSRSREGFIRVEISDNGPGISPENMKRIFEPFFTTKPVGKGTGLGLSLVFGIVQEHGGRIDVQSELGRGATFIVELPIAAEATADGNEPAKARVRPKLPAGSSGKLVLVVDDEEWILELAREILGSIGHGVEIAGDGEAALATVERRNFDAIVCDWKMPGMNGVQFYEKLKEAKPEAAERVLFMSGEVLDAGFQSFLRQNERTCLSKPFAIEEFRDAVEKLLSMRG